MRAIFISYRRDDSEGQAGRLYDDLARRFGENTVFMDVAGIEPGLDFRRVIDQHVASCGVLLAMIGPAWIDVKNETGQRRLDDPMDFVRLETASALARDIIVIPVLVHGAKMPREDQLPDDLKDLAYRNGLELTHARWDSDVEILIKALDRYLGDLASALPETSLDPVAPEAGFEKPHPRWQSEGRKPFRMLAAVGVVLALVVSLVLYLLLKRAPGGISDQSQPTPARSTPQTVLAPPAATPRNSIPNFAGTWELVEYTKNGRQKPVTGPLPFSRRPITITQDGSLVRSGSSSIVRTINSTGEVTFTSLFAADDKRLVQTEGEADLVRTVIWRIEGSLLVIETASHYKTPFHLEAPYPSSTPGMDVSITKYRRVSPTPSMDGPWQNSLGMKFVPVPGTQVLFSIWDTRVADFLAYAQDTGYRQQGGIDVLKVLKNPDGTYRLDRSADPAASWENPGFSQGANNPVVGVSWNEAKAFCDWLTKKEQRAGLIGTNQFYRLPADQEWSAAAGSGKYPWGNDWPPPRGAGNYRDDAFVAALPGTGWQQVPGNDGYARTSPVGSFSANQYGLYDMGGNVWQWCEDWLDSGPNFCLLRGGSWAEYTQEALSSSSRRAVTPDSRIDRRGFRCVLARGIPAQPAQTTPQTVPAQPPVIPADSIPRFAGAWQPIESTYNGQQKPIASVPRVTFTQDGSLVRIGNRAMRITSSGTVTYKEFWASDNRYGHAVQNEAEAALVDTLTWRIDGSTLVFETTFNYRTQYFAHPPGTDVRIMKYRRVPATAPSATPTPLEN